MFLGFGVFGVCIFKVGYLEFLSKKFLKFFLVRYIK